LSDLLIGFCFYVTQFPFWLKEHTDVPFQGSKMQTPIYFFELWISHQLLDNSFHPLTFFSHHRLNFLTEISFRVSFRCISVLKIGLHLNCEFQSKPLFNICLHFHKMMVWLLELLCFALRNYRRFSFRKRMKEFELVFEMPKELKISLKTCG